MAWNMDRAKDGFMVLTTPPCLPEQHLPKAVGLVPLSPTSFTIKTNVFKHKMETQDTYHNVHNMDLGKVYLIGHDSLFTTYYQGKIEDGNGNPTVIILISGTMAFDSHTGEFLGVKDYLFGKKILDYEYQPTQAFAPNTIEIKKHSGLSPKSEWIEQ